MSSLFMLTEAMIEEINLDTAKFTAKGMNVDLLSMIQQGLIRIDGRHKETGDLMYAATDKGIAVAQAGIQ